MAESNKVHSELEPRMTILQDAYLELEMDAEARCDKGFKDSQPKTRNLVQHVLETRVCN
jgi:hypothetical protein